MGWRDKLVERFRTTPKDFRWDELVRLLKSLGYRRVPSGRTGGSRRRSVHDTAPVMNLHRPHPGNVVRAYVLRDVLEVLTRENLM